MFETDKYIYNVEGYGRFMVYKDCYISKHLKLGRLWEPHLLPVFKKYISKNSVVLEAGTHIGPHSVIIAQMCQTLHGFEPLDPSRFLLKENLKLNNLSNVIVYDKGLSDASGSTSFEWIRDSNPGGAGLANNPDGSPESCKAIDNKESMTVELITIDSLDLNRIDFIKLDVEGYETKAIQGGIKTIERDKPVITIECYKNWEGEIPSKDYVVSKFNMLTDLGYRYESIAGPDFLCIPP